MIKFLVILFLILPTFAAAPQKQVAFKNCASFTKCITNIHGKTKNQAQNLDLVMPMYNLI